MFLSGVCVFILSISRLISFCNVVVKWEKIPNIEGYEDIIEDTNTTIIIIIVIIVLQ